MNKILAVAVSAGLGLCCTAAVAANRSDAGWVRPNPAVEVPAGGGSCATPTSITALPFSQAGNTCGGANNISNYGGGICDASLAFPYPGPEDVWAITVGTGNAITVQADLSGSTGDLALFFLSECGDGDSCMFTSQDAIGPGAGPEALNNTAPPGSPPVPGVLTGLSAGSTYYVYVDSYYGTGSASCGSYTLQVAGTLPVSLDSYRID
ncbi:hypothetical protein [Dokdonella koreensis]|uniref:Peptidase C-terminal archaeal/bacterial domain-containing protein n=1 Tax=Dokdonella koreensis DS-123 TaxID=1300342 RepID=A0A160DVI3_9GAMM|nr:hypothetical protein [Dokdonella koreensis]ANB18364.1 Hypothetical protein I596_2356 [Dokdonella koreensis DS-123]